MFSSRVLPFRRVKVALRRENVRPWHEVEHDFIECEYRAVRDRQMKELELEDDLLSKVPVRCVTLIASDISILLMVSKKSPRQALQGVFRIREAAKNTMPTPGCLVRECASTIVSPGSCPKTKSALAFHETGRSNYVIHENTG